MKSDIDQDAPNPTLGVVEPPNPSTPHTPDPPKKKRLASDAVWLLTGQLSTAVATLVGVRLLTEAIRPEIYGSVNLIAGILLLGRNLFCFPFYQAALRFFPEVNREKEAWRLRRILFSYLTKSSTILVVLIVLIGIPFCVWAGLTLALVPIMIGLLYVDIYRTMETDLLNAARKQRTFSILRAAEAWSRSLVPVMMARWLGADPVVVLGGYLLASGGVLASIFVFKVDRVGMEPATGEPGGPKDLALGERLWKFSLPLVPLAILEWTTTLSNRYLVGGLLGLESAGIFVAAYGLVSQPFLMSSGVLEMLSRPMYFEAVAAGDQKRALKVFHRWLLACSVICGLGVLAITILQDPLTRLLLARKYQSASSLLPWIAAGNAMFAITMVFEKVFHAAHRTELVLVSRVIGAVLSVVVGVPLILTMGTFGAAVSVPIYYGAQFLVAMALAKRISASN